MPGRSYVGGLEWAPSSGGSAQDMESWEASAQDRVYLSVDGLRDRPYEGEWNWQAQHRANGWYKLYGTDGDQQDAMKAAAKAVSYIDEGFSKNPTNPRGTFRKSGKNGLVKSRSGQQP